MNNLGRKENIFWESISIGFSEAVSLLLAIFNLRKMKKVKMQYNLLPYKQLQSQFCILEHF